MGMDGRGALRKKGIRLIAALLALMLLPVAALAETLDLPVGLRSIEAEAFMGDTSLERVVVPAGTESIGERAFAGSGLREIVLPETLRQIADDAFAGCEGLRVTAEAARDSYVYRWCVENGYLADEVTVTLDAGEGRFADGEQTRAVTCAAGEPLPELPEPMLPGRHLAAWLLGEEPVAADYAPTEDVTLTAQWGEGSPRFYCPQENQDLDYDDPDSRWCWQRSRESEHFFLFWEPGFGLDPNADEVPEALRVDTADLLAKAERFWHTNVDTLGMAEVGVGRSRLDSCKMQIYLLYTEDWVATGSGYDDMIGALWVSPMTCHPVGSTIAHEIGHCFQYQVYCDQLLNGGANDFHSGFRYGYPGSNGGNGFWEQCAQWVSFVDYPAEALTGWDFDSWPGNAHRAFEHEWTRYQSYWLQMYWTEKHGRDAVARVWRESRYPEDALTAYCRIFCGGSAEVLNAELYEYAARMATFDLPGLSAWSGARIGSYRPVFYKYGAWQQVAYASCPGEGGFNVIDLDIAGRDTVTVEFSGLKGGATLATGDPGRYHKGEDEYGAPKVAGTVHTYNKTSAQPGWRYGFVALMEDGRRVYGEPCAEQNGTISWTLEPGTESLYLVVVGAMQSVTANPWDDNERTDAQAPYRYRVVN